MRVNTWEKRYREDFLLQIHSYFIETVYDCENKQNNRM